MEVDQDRPARKPQSPPAPTEDGPVYSTWPPRELASQLLQRKIDDGNGGLRVLKAAEIADALIAQLGVSGNIARSATRKAINALDPGNPARRTHKPPVARRVDAAMIARMQELWAQGKTQKEIAVEIGAHERTVKKHLSLRVTPHELVGRSAGILPAQEDGMSHFVTLDFEASSLPGPGSFPIEVAVAFVDSGDVRSWLIRPEPRWNSDGRWDSSAQRHHGIDRARLSDEGRPVVEVVRQLTDAVQGRTVVSDYPPADSFWLEALYASAGQKPPFRIGGLAQLLEKLTAASGKQGYGQIDEAVNLARKRFPLEHRAGPDARRVAEIIRIVAGKAEPSS
jgi:hypothetical protein